MRRRCSSSSGPTRARRGSTARCCSIRRDSSARGGSWTATSRTTPGRCCSRRASQGYSRWATSDRARSRGWRPRWARVQWPCASCTSTWRSASGTTNPSGRPAIAVAAVIFDLDGVLIDSEAVWNTARREVALQHGGRWPDDAQRTMMGMSSTEWSAYMHGELGVSLPTEQISETVVSRLEELYRDNLPLLPGARETVIGFSREWPLGLASSANRPLIDLVLDLAGLTDSFAASVSSEEVPRGKPAPDVYLEAALRLRVEPGQCVAVEDSSNGIRSAAAAGMTVIAVPNRDFPPAREAVELADDVAHSLAELVPERVEGLARGGTVGRD